MPDPSPDPALDLPRLREVLRAVEAEAAVLPWAAERPWRAERHVRVEADLLHVDLHDLNARCARLAVRALAEVAPALGSGAVRLVTGVGAHSLGPGVLGGAVAKELSALGRRHGWTFHPAGRGAFVLVFDPARAPRRAFSSLDPIVFPFIALIALGVAAAWPWVGIPACVALAAFGVRAWCAGRARARGLSSARPPEIPPMALPPDSTAPEAPPDAPPAGPPPRILGDLGYTALAVLWAILIIAAGAWLQSR